MNLIYTTIIFTVVVFILIEIVGYLIKKPINKKIVPPLAIALAILSQYIL